MPDAASAPARSIGQKVADGLQNVISGVGTSRDRRMFDRYSVHRALSKAEIDAAYRTSGIVRKVHDLPPYDETRAWRNWQAEADVITAIQAEEKRLGLRQKVRQARTWARLYGGAAIILGVPGADTMEPYDPATLGKGGLRYLHVVTRWQVGVGPLNNDLGSDYFHQPAYYTLNSQGGQVKIDPSRVIPFVSQPLPPDSIQVMGSDGFWGDPLLMLLEKELKNADLAPSAIATMLHEAKVDTISIPGLMSLLGTAGYEQRLQARLQAAEMAKSILNTRILDAEEKWETRQISFTNLPELIDKFWQLVAAVSDIPVTRLLGTSAKGLNATGEGDNDNYDEMVEARQENELRPLLERIDDSLLASAGIAPGKASFEFADLDEADPSEEADLQAKRAATAKSYVDSGLVPRAAMAVAVQTALVEDAVYPGLEAALADLKTKRGDVALVGFSVDELKAIAPVWQSGGLPKQVIFQLLLDAGLLPDDVNTFEAFQQAIEDEGEALGTMADPMTGDPVDPNAPPVGGVTKPGPGSQQPHTAQDAAPRTQEDDAAGEAE